MATKIQLSDGVVISVEVSLEDMQKAYETALATNQMLTIEDPDGNVRAVNPLQILYIEANGNGASAAFRGETVVEEAGSV